MEPSTSKTKSFFSRYSLTLLVSLTSLFVSSFSIYIGYKSNSIAAKGVKLELYSKLSPLLIEMEERGEAIEMEFESAMSGGMPVDSFLTEVEHHLKFNMDNYEQINILMTKSKRKNIDTRMEETQGKIKSVLNDYNPTTQKKALGEALWPLLIEFNEISYEMRKALKEEIYF